MTTDSINIGFAPPSVPLPGTARPPTANQDALKLATKALEASFIAEMLKSAGAGKSRKTFGGGAGEDAFSSFLVTAQANKIADSGGFGLAVKIYTSLKLGPTSNG